MSDKPEFDRTSPDFKKKILTLAVILILIFSAALLMINPLLNSPYVSTRISAFLSERLRQKIVVGGLRLSAGSIMANGVSIANPPGFPDGNLIKVGYLEIYPDWRFLLMGKREFKSIRIHGFHADLMKDGAGNWNFSAIKTLIKGKKEGAEMRLRELSLDEGSLSVAGRGIRDITLSVRNLSTRGSTNSQIDLSFCDENGSSYHIDGNGRLGVAPTIQMKLTAPIISLKSLNKFNIPVDTERGRGGLELSLAFGNDELKVRGEAKVDPLIFKIRGETGSHRAYLSFSGHYLHKRDQAALDSANLRVDDGSLRLQAKGLVESLSKEKDFSFEISHQGIQMADIFRLVPMNLIGGFKISGELLPATVMVKGRVGEGITSAGTNVAIRRFTVSRNNLILAENIFADANIKGQNDGWRLKGKLSQGKQEGTTLILFRDIPFYMEIDRRFRPTRGGIPSFSAELAGVPVKGSILIREDVPEPFTARIDFNRGNLEGLSRRFSVKGLALGKGTVTGLVKAYGNLSGKIDCDVDLVFSELQGKYSDKDIKLGRLSLDGSIKRVDGVLSAFARIGAREGVLDGREFSFSIPCTVRGKVLAVEGGEGRYDKYLYRLGKLKISSPGDLKGEEGKKIPIGVNFSGINITRGEIGAGGISGVIHAKLSKFDQRLRIEGDGLFELPVISFRGKKTGSLFARFGANGRRITIDANGEMLGGNVKASATRDLADFRSVMGGSLILKGVSGEQLSEIVGKAYPVRIIAGSIDLVAKGKYEDVNGLTSRISLTGRDIALSGENRKTIFSGGKLDISADLAKRDLLIREAVATVGEKLKVGLKGTLKNVAVPERVGDFSLELPGIEIASILDIFANALPPFLQEAEAKGSVRIKSKIKTWGKGGKINGEIEIEDGGLDIPSQKLTVTGVRGTVPFETVLNGSPPQQWDKGRVKRDNYLEMLSLLKGAASEGYNLIIERIRFGAAEFTDTRFSIGTGNGVTEVKSLTSRLFHGEILGRGSFSLSGGDRFGGDILVHDLSLKELCDSYPAIRGYMTGRVNGFVSLFAAGRGLTALKGLMEFWARSAAGEKMLISKDFLQKLSGKKLKGLFFQNDRPYDRGEIAAYLEDGYLTFQTMDISHTNLLGMRDLSVAVAPVQNKISLEHLLATIREAASRGKAATGGGGSEPSSPGMEFKWEE